MVTNRKILSIYLYKYFYALFLPLDLFQRQNEKVLLGVLLVLEINIFEYIGIAGEMEITISKAFCTRVSAMKALPRTITASQLHWRKKL